MSSGPLVAPHTGAWIETRGAEPGGLADRSPLTQGRGLKLFERYDVPRLGLVSPLTQGRGLKLILVSLEVTALVVAPHTGAWIETARNLAKQNG